MRTDHMLQSRGREVARRQRNFPPSCPIPFQETVTGVKLGTGGYLLQWYLTVKGPGYRQGRPRPVSPKKQ